MAKKKGQLCVSCCCSSFAFHALRPLLQGVLLATFLIILSHDPNYLIVNVNLAGLPSVMLELYLNSSGNYYYRISLTEVEELNFPECGPGLNIPSLRQREPIKPGRSQDKMGRMERRRNGTMYCGLKWFWCILFGYLRITRQAKIDILVKLCKKSGTIPNYRT